MAPAYREDVTTLAVNDVTRRIGVAWRELRRGAVTGRLRAELYGEGPDALDVGQVDALDLLASEGPSRMSNLADSLRIEASTATRAVDRLVADRLAVRERSTEDARVVVVSLTDEGRRRHEALVHHRRAAMIGILGAFDGDELPVLADLLERLVGAVDTYLEAHA